METIDSTKEQRPECPYTEDGKHTWIEYAGNKEKTCHDCGYTEPLHIPVV